MARPRGSARAIGPSTVVPSDRLPTTSAIRTSPSSRASCHLGRGRIGPRIRGRAGAGRVASEGPAVIAVVPSWYRPREPHPDLADLDLVPEPERRDAVDPVAVHVRAVRAPQVLDIPGAAAIGQDRVLRR